jgi:hypothetical protein
MSSSNSGSSRVEDGTSRGLALVGARDESALNLLAGCLEGPATELEGIGCERDEGGQDIVRVVVVDGWEDE